MSHYDHPTATELKNYLQKLNSIIADRVKPAGEWVCEDIRELININSIEECVIDLVKRQREINETKAIQAVERKTLAQCQGYLERLFSNKDEEEFLLVSSLMLLYLQERKGVASWNGFEKFVRVNKSKNIKDLTSRYFNVIWDDEKEVLYDLIEQSTMLEA